MQLLQEALDDPSAAPCGRCSVCTGSLPDGLEAEPDLEVTRSVAGVLRTQTHRVEPRKMWPGGAFGSRGRIPVSEQPEVGRALIHADAPEWRELVAQVFGGADAGPPDELVDAVVALLGSWRRDWTKRPEVVTGLPAAGFRELTAGLVQRIATVGRLDTAELAVDGAAPADLTSAAEAAYWARAIGVPDPSAIAGRVVLLVTDATSSLWPGTIAASKLRSVGASAVLPLVVHRRP
jgi:ATP-dependent DNA helicase RecQ